MHEDLVTEDVIAEFESSGVVCIRGLISQEDVERLRESIEYALEHPADETENRAAKAGKAGRFVGEHSLWGRYDEIREFMLRAPLAAAAGALMRSSTTRMFNDVMFVKEPGTHVRSPWHQDMSYYRIRGRQTASAWVALDDVSAETGAVEFVIGTHAGDDLYVPIDFGSDQDLVQDGVGDLRRLPDINGKPDEYPRVSFDMAPGDATFHDFRLVHGAPGNHSMSTRRRAYAVRMCGDDIRWTDSPYASTGIGQYMRAGEALHGDDFPLLWSATDDHSLISA